MFLLLLAMPLASATMRNPFQPFISPCDALVHKLSQWALYGTLGVKNDVIALMRSPENGWRRVISTTELEDGAKIEIIGSHAVSVRLSSDCAQPLYTWKLRGTKHDMDATRHFANSLAALEPR